jgi:septum formation protein
MYKDKIREKPIDENEARKFLNSWNEEPAVIIGSVVVVNTKTGEKASGLQKSRVHFKVISEKVIDEHIRNGSSMRGCGGISITDPILHDYIKNIEGGFDSAAGLSKELVKRLVIQVGGDSIFMSKNEK